MWTKRCLRMIRHILKRDINERGPSYLIPEHLAIYLYIYALTIGLDNDLSHIAW